MKCEMLSAEDIAAVKVAIGTCNNPEVKREVLCAPGSDYDINKKSNRFGTKKQWYEIVEKKAALILGNIGLPKKLHEKIMNLVPLVGMRMLTWAEYHGGTLGFSREYSMDFLSCSVFTSQGIIDNKKAAAELMNDKNLSIKQKYKLACLYCFTDYIPVFYRQMVKEDKEEFYDAQNPRRIEQPGLVKFWSYYLMGEIDKLRRGKNLDIYRLEMSIESGSKVAVEYCLEKTNLSRKKNALIDGAVEAVKCRTKKIGDWILFSDPRYAKCKVTWVPNDYYVDILCFLLSKMREDQQLDFLKKDIEGAGYIINYYKCKWRLSVLQYFLKWPYQVYFLNTAKLMWGILPESNYAVLLLRICGKIESEDGIKYGEENIYDYRGLLKEFWCRSTEHYKRYVFSNPKVEYSSERMFKVRAGAELLVKLLTLKHFTYEDIKIIKLILASATSKEKENIISSQDWKNFCVDMIKVEKWEILDRIVQNCFLTKEEADQFRRELSFTKDAQRVCIDFVKNYKLNAADLFINWSSLPEEEKNKLKIEMIHSEDGMSASVKHILYDKKFKAVDKFIRWYFLTVEEVGKFKKELILSCHGRGTCSFLLRTGEIELANEFTKWCLSSEEEIIELKKNVAYTYGYCVFEKLISDFSEEYIDEDIGYSKGMRIKFEGAKWEQVEQYLTWCFSSEEEIGEFKKELFKISGKEIHFKLIISNQWEEAETFYAWLALSAEEIKELKKETLFNYDAGAEMFSELMYKNEGYGIFVNYGSKQEAIELLLRWYLTDKETVLEFNDHIKKEYDSEEINEKSSEVLKNFDLAIMQRLSDLDEEQRVVKRKSETFSPNKRFCNVELENEGAVYAK